MTKYEKLLNKGEILFKQIASELNIMSEQYIRTEKNFNRTEESYKEIAIALALLDNKPLRKIKKLLCR